MVIAAFLVIPLLAIEESGLGGPWLTLGITLNWGTWLAFVVEASAMLYVTPRRREWIRQNPLDVAIVVLTPPFLPGNLAAVRLLRVLRLARLFALRRLLSLDGVRSAAFLAGFLVLIGGAAYSAVEKSGQGHTVWDGIWWALVTVTTVGYGDTAPETSFGRLIAAVVMLVGIGFVALLTAFIAERFIDKAADDKAEARDDRLLAELQTLGQRLTHLERRIAAPAEKDT